MLAAIGDLNFTGAGPYVVYANVSDIIDDYAILEGVSNVSSWAKIVSKANNGYVKAAALENIFEIQHKLVFEDLVPDAEIIVTASSSNIVIAHWGLMPFSRGSVHIASPNPIEPPLIDPKYFLLNADLVIQTAIARFSRSILCTRPLSKLVQQELAPGLTQVPYNATTSQWTDFVKSASK